MAGKKKILTIGKSIIGYLLINGAVSCVKIILPGTQTETAIDTTVVKKLRQLPHFQPKPEQDTTETPDTVRVPIGFNPTVADWDTLTENTTL